MGGRHTELQTKDRSEDHPKIDLLEIIMKNPVWSDANVFQVPVQLFSN